MKSKDMVSREELENAITSLKVTRLTSVQELSAEIKSSQELRKDKEDRYDGSQRLLRELQDKLDSRDAV